MFLEEIFVGSFAGRSGQMRPARAGRAPGFGSFFGAAAALAHASIAWRGSAARARRWAGRRLFLLCALWLCSALASAEAAFPHGIGASGADPVVTIRRLDAMLAQGGEPQPRHQNGSEPIAVLFPDIGEPFRKVFAEILAGIAAGTRLGVRGYPISTTPDGAEMAAELKRNGARVIVALGRQGLKAAAGLDLPVIVSGVSSVPDPDKQVGICLTPDPGLLFAKLKLLLPATRRVFVVYNPVYNEWQIKLAREAARALGLELVAYEARDLASAARLYQGAFAGADKRYDAFWLPIDATAVDEATILPIVLGESWNRNIPVFSSSFLHVRKGALFALYPDNIELGRALAGLAVAELSGEASRRGVAPLRSVHAALNLRTAGHLGIAVGARAQRGFDFLYSEP